MYYHYTTILHLPFILKSGVLKPSRQDAHGAHRFGLLWFSTNGLMEQSAKKGGVLMVRIGSTDRRIRPWKSIGKQAGYSSSVMRRLQASGRRMGAVPSQWFAMRGDLSIEGLRIEGLLDGQWVAIEETELVVDGEAGSLLSIQGPGGLAAVVGRQRTHEGYFAYATNAASYEPRNLFPQNVKSVVRG